MGLECACPERRRTRATIGRLHGQDHGTDLTDGIVLLGGVPQTVLFTDATQIVFDVSADTPLGPTVLAVTNALGSGELAVEVAAPPPQIDTVNPSPIVLGTPFTVTGSALSGVAAVKLGPVDCTITEQLDTVLAAVAPRDLSLPGAQVLTLQSAAGATTTDVTVSAPPPTIDSLSPNPVRQGDLLTIGGLHPGLGAALSVGAMPCTLLDVGNPTVVQVQVPLGAPTGPSTVTAALANEPNIEAGPLYVEAAALERPTVIGLYPSTIQLGGVARLVGQHLDSLTTGVGLTVDDCDQRSCRVTPDNLGVGSWTAAVSGLDGAALVSLTVSDSDSPTPTLTEVTPSPAFIGDTVTLTGGSLLGVTDVVVGDTPQAITYQDDTRLEFSLVEGTPEGAEPVFVAAASASNVLSVTVLSPFPSPEDDVTPPTADDPEQGDTPARAEPTTDGDDTTTNVPASDDGSAAPATETGDSGGCATSPTSPAPLPGVWVIFLGWLVWAVRGIGRPRA